MIEQTELKNEIEMQLFLTYKLTCIKLACSQRATIKSGLKVGLSWDAVNGF